MNVMKLDLPMYIKWLDLILYSYIMRLEFLKHVIILDPLMYVTRLDFLIPRFSCHEKLLLISASKRHLLMYMMRLYIFVHVIKADHMFNSSSNSAFILKIYVGTFVSRHNILD
jgi:hypothetical protein